MKDNKGFTLIELLVVVAIIGILAAVGTVAYQGYTSGAKKNATKSNQATVTKFIAAELAKCNMGEATTMVNAAGTGYSCASTTAGEVSTAAASALSDFKNTYSPATAAVAKSSALVLGQTSVSDDGSTVNIETCFSYAEVTTPAAGAVEATTSDECESGNATSTMKNTVTIE